MSEMILGIDLGTTNSAVGVVDSGFPILLANEDGRRITPSAVWIGKDGTVEVGAKALRRRALEPERVVTSIKRLMGRRTSEVEENFPVPVDRRSGWPAAGAREIAGGNQRGNPAGNEAHRRVADGRGNHQGGDHRARLFPRRPTRRHQARRRTRRAGSGPHPQRTDRRGAGLRLGQTRRESRASRFTISAAALSIYRFWKCRTACSRCSPPTATPGSAAMIWTR